MAANKVKGEVTLVLGKKPNERTYTLALDHEALLSIEDATGLPLPRVMAMAGEGFISSTAAIAQAAFARHHPEVTRAEVVKMVMSDDSEALEEALGNAVEAAFPDSEKSGNGKAPKAKTPRGKTSGRSGAKRS